MKYKRKHIAVEKCKNPAPGTVFLLENLRFHIEEQVSVCVVCKYVSVCVFFVCLCVVFLIPRTRVAYIHTFYVQGKGKNAKGKKIKATKDQVYLYP